MKKNRRSLPMNGAPAAPLRELDSWLNASMNRSSPEALEEEADAVRELRKERIP